MKMLMTLAVIIIAQATCLAQNPEGVSSPLNQLGLRAGIDQAACGSPREAETPRAPCVRAARTILMGSKAYRLARASDRELADQWRRWALAHPGPAIELAVRYGPGSRPDPVSRPRAVPAPIRKDCLCAVLFPISVAA